MASVYPQDSISSESLTAWIHFLHKLVRDAYTTLRRGGFLALLLAPQTEKDLPSGCGYLDHSVLGYLAATLAGFQPQRRISCPMSCHYSPQQVRQARLDARLLGQVRDLLILRKPASAGDTTRHEPAPLLGDLETYFHILTARK